jgi:glycogen(starch) synthase
VKVAVFASAYAPHVGGVEHLVQKLAVEYRRAGHDAFVITNRWPRDLPLHEVIDGIDVYRPALRWPVGPRKATVTYHATHQHIAHEVNHIIERERADVLHVQCVSANGLYALRCKRRLGLPLVVTAQGELTMDVGGIFQRYRFVHDLLENLAAEADVFTACSAKTLADVENYLGRSLGAKARVIHNGADPREFQSVSPHRTTKPYLLAIGRLVPQKGFDLLIDAYARARPSLDLVIAGDGPEEIRLRQLADQLGVAESVQFVGAVDRRSAAALFLGSEFVAVPSRADEGLPLVVVEAMTAGRPLLVTDTGGVREAVRPDRSALVVPKGDVTALAESLTSLSEDAALRQRLGYLAQQDAERFTWQRLAACYLDAFEDAISMHAGVERS